MCTQGQFVDRQKIEVFEYFLFSSELCFVVVVLCVCFVVCVRVYVLKNLFALKKSENVMQEYFFQVILLFLEKRMKSPKKKC